MKHPPQIEHDRYYHIFNRGVNSQNLFPEPSNYDDFMELYAIHILPVAETYAWALMKNHFHFLVKILPTEEISFIIPKEHQKDIQYSVQKKYTPTQQFGNLFNAYAKTINNKYHRTGPLFESPFKRKLVSDEKYLKELVFYIHNNPVHHGVSKSLADYPWTSYHAIISSNRTNVMSDKVLQWFNSEPQFVQFHMQEHDIQNIGTVTIE
jgi:putative transposase